MWPECRRLGSVRHHRFQTAGHFLHLAAAAAVSNPGCAAAAPKLKTGLLYRLVPHPMYVGVLGRVGDPAHDTPNMVPNFEAAAATARSPL